MGEITELDVGYSELGDLLSIWTKPPEGGAKVVTMKPDCSSFYAEGKCVGVYWYDAGRILLPILTQDDISEAAKYPELLVDYCREADVLVFGNREAVARSEEMAAGFIAHIDRAGLVNRFTLEDASATLLPHFLHPVDGEYGGQPGQQPAGADSRLRRNDG